MTEGPLGFPMPDAAARRLDAALRALPRGPDFAYRKSLAPAPPPLPDPGDRADVSWITTEAPDGMREVVLADGLDDSHFRLNPVVTLNHDYALPAVGRSTWRRRSDAGPGGRPGVRARTHYPPAPPGWPADAPWLPDTALALIRAGLLAGKSVGFLPVRSHAPGPREAEANGWDGVTRVIDEWLLLEYACVSLPANHEALVEVVAKAAPALPPAARRALGVPAPATPFTPLAEVESAVRRALAAAGLPGRLARAARDALDRAAGRV